MVRSEYLGQTEIISSLEPRLLFTFDLNILHPEKPRGGLFWSPILSDLNLLELIHSFKFKNKLKVKYISFWLTVVCYKNKIPEQP